MLGQPTETEEDLLGIVDLCRKVSAVGKHQRKVTASVSTFIPKPHTPFQWAAMDDKRDVARKQWMLKDRLRKERGIKLRTHDCSSSVLEGVIARGDRRLADVIERAWRSGARFDSWDEHLDLSRWDEALDLVADKLVEHRGHFGAFSSAKATNEDNYLIQKFVRLLMGTNNIDHCTRLCHAPSVEAMLAQLGSGVVRPAGGRCAHRLRRYAGAGDRRRGAEDRNRHGGYASSRFYDPARHGIRRRTPLRI